MIESSRRAGERDAEAIVENFYERIYRFLRRLTGNDHDAADLTQQTFGRAWQKKETFEGKASVGSWLHRIAYNLYVDWRRQNWRGDERSADWWEGCVAIEPPPDVQAARTDLDASVYRSVEGLAKDLRDTLHLHFYQELTLQETADIMNVALSTVKYRKQQALAELRRLVETSHPPVPNTAN
jgi:RNA polymerase sigma-70 factor (ECF subfamily)